jgi:hypothetical protein
MSDIDTNMNYVKYTTGEWGGKPVDHMEIHLPNGGVMQVTIDAEHMEIDLPLLDCTVTKPYMNEVTIRWAPCPHNHVERTPGGSWVYCYDCHTRVKNQ